MKSRQIFGLNTKEMEPQIYIIIPIIITSIVVDDDDVMLLLMMIDWGFLLFKNVVNNNISWQ